MRASIQLTIDFDFNINTQPDLLLHPTSQCSIKQETSTVLMFEVPCSSSDVPEKREFGVQLTTMDSFMDLGCCCLGVSPALTTSLRQEARLHQEPSSLAPPRLRSENYLRFREHQNIAIQLTQRSSVFPSLFELLSHQPVKQSR